MIEKIINRLIILTLIFFQKKNYTCNVCKKRINKFDRLSDYFLKKLDEYAYVHSLFAGETMNLFQYSCPVCYCTDRDRLYILYLEKYLKNIDQNTEFHFLDIAPAHAFSKWMKKNRTINYRTVDLYMKNVDDKADITNLNIYPDKKFDFVLCSHVMEHIKNDRKAMSEIFRILKPGGRAIIMVPILLTIETDLENPDFKTEAQRWKYYGQDDHVRMYSKNGFISKLKETGFNVSEFGIDYFGADNFLKHGIHNRSILYVVNK